MHTSRRPTLRDVSQRVELSVTQVSRALNGHEDVADDTRAAVLEAAEALGYVPNHMARQLKMPSLRANAIGIVLPATTLSFSYPFVGSLVAGFIEGANRRQVEVDISTVSNERDELATYRRAIDQRRVDGFLLLRTRVDDRRVGFLTGEGVPFATFGRAAGATVVPAVDDTDDCMLPVVEHLAGLGHRRIGCVAEPVTFARSHLRLRSFEAAMAACGLEVDPSLMTIAEFEQQSGRAAGLELLAAAAPPTAIVALNDMLAIGVLAAAADRGLRVPDDLSVTGFDDVHLAALANPPLTTLRVDGERVGTALADGLLRAIDRREVAAPLLLRPELVDRGSTSSPAAAR